MRIDVTGCTVAFGPRVVLDSLQASFVGPGMVALMGPSGSGKTTLLGVIAGVVRTAPGTVRLNGVAKAPEDWEWIVQATPLLGRRSAFDNVILGPAARGLAAGPAPAAAWAAMAALGISELADQKVYKLSGGERQRVAVARALAGGADLILADEPTASLDPRSRELVCDGLGQAAERGALVLVATHDPYVAGRADVAYRLEDGRLADGG
ncbi:MAG: ATP-binding cassette domain-containing protein [Bifidobacteriaceae bacterium]|jgi:ABC-type lipoprotein export system ATPase subunit|nr:ATP-binding cassette domain-containing protein [Bifidobacteriaceae bacterium]